MLKYPSLFPKRRIAKRLPEYQCDIAALMRDQTPGEAIARVVWSFMSRVLGHANECLFDSALLSSVDEVSIPGGDDEENRFITEVLLGDPEASSLQLANAMNECRRHRVHWLIWTDGPTWHVAHVFGKVGLPAAFISIDLFLPNGVVADELYRLSFEGMLAGELKRAWENAQRLVA